MASCGGTVPSQRQSCLLNSILVCLFPPSRAFVSSHTVCSSNLAPDDANLGAADLLLCAVDICDTLSEVERSGLGVVDALNQDERGVWVGVALATLV